jgi:hypothetical protein
MVVDDEEHKILVHQTINSRRHYSVDENWRWNLEIDGGFGWGAKYSSFGASKKRRLSPSKQGGVSRGGRKRWCRMKNPPVQPLEAFRYVG